ncbi:MAG TPA: amidohydrolase [Nitrososphaerales archaeon]|nr:amidohydrolase [Nitrososphaerales archaeon]
MIPDSLKESIVSAVDSNKDLLFQISRFVHSHPEPNYEEFQCSKYLVEQLSRLGFSVEYPFCNIKTAFKGTIVNGEGPHVAILAEFDGLPVTMPDGSSPVVHACGHNLNCSAAVGAALALKSVSSQLPGTVSIIGTPAEEGGGGKVALLEKGAFRNVDAILTVHGDQRDWYTVARACSAGEFLHVTFLGRPASEGYSRNYVNAVDAAVLFLTVLGFLDSRLTPDSLIQRRIVPGNQAVNTIPLECAVDVQIRSGDESYLERMKSQVIQAAEGVAGAIGAHVRIDQRGYRYERIIENKTLEEVAKRNIERLGHKFTYDEVSPYPFGTDTGNLSHHIPTVQFLIGRPEGFRFHTPEAVKQSISDSAQNMMIESAKILAATTADILLDTGLSQTAKKELEQYRERGFSGLYSWHRKV